MEKRRPVASRHRYPSPDPTDSKPILDFFGTTTFFRASPGGLGAGIVETMEEFEWLPATDGVRKDNGSVSLIVVDVVNNRNAW